MHVENVGKAVYHDSNKNLKLKIRTYSQSKIDISHLSMHTGRNATSETIETQDFHITKSYTSKRQKNITRCIKNTLYSTIKRINPEKPHEKNKRCAISNAFK